MLNADPVFHEQSPTPCQTNPNTQVAISLQLDVDTTQSILVGSALAMGHNDA